SVDVSNAGTGLLTVSELIINTNSGGEWLIASTSGSGTAGSTNVSTIDVSVNAIGLGNGSYTGSVRVVSDGGTATLGVTLTVGGGGSVPGYEVFVLAVDVNADPPETRAQFVLNTGGSLDYRLRELEAGGYVIVAGTDEDNDGFICDEGEPLCGLYPSLGLATLVTLGETGEISGLDFPLEQPNFGASTGAVNGAPPGGYRLINPGTR
ncbi:MAG: hypothetical protein AAGG01_15850, partial [Planctomycetota bacterium]